MARRTYFLFSPTDDFPLASYREVQLVVEPHRETKENSEDIKRIKAQARKYVAEMGPDNVCWDVLSLLLDELDALFVESLHSPNDEVDVTQLIGMPDLVYESRMGQYFSEVHTRLKNKIFDKKWTAKEEAMAKALLYKMRYLRELRPCWPLLTKSAVMALSDSLKCMHGGIKEVRVLSHFRPAPSTLDPMAQRQCCMLPSWGQRQPPFNLDPMAQQQCCHLGSETASIHPRSNGTAAAPPYDWGPMAA